MRVDPSILISYCKKYFPRAEIYSAYEAGFCGFYLHRRLKSEGINNIVVDAAGIEIAASDRVKTDKRDSLKLAIHLSLGKLNGIFIPSIEQEDHRAVTRLRDSFVRERSRLACQIKALMYQHNLIQADDTRMISQKWVSSQTRDFYCFLLSQRDAFWALAQAVVDSRSDASNISSRVTLDFDIGCAFSAVYYSLC